MTTIDTTLTERYVQEVVRRIPADQREDVADELRNTIADTIEARGPQDSAQAEREVINQMGDPIRLAAGYADRPLALIGPDLYPVYIRLLRILLSTVLPVVTVVIVAIEVLETNNIGTAIGSGIGALLTVGAQMIAWLTVVFALVDRAQHRGEISKTTKLWTVDQLPELRRPDQKSAAACGAIAWNAILIGAILWQHLSAPYPGNLEVLNPELWSGPIWPVLAGLTGMVVVELIRVVVRGWTIPLVVWYTIANALFATALAWILLDHSFFNPQFLEAASSTNIPDEFYTIAAVVVVAISVGEVLRRFRQALRQ